MNGKKFDQDKNPIGLIPSEFEDAVAEVLKFGAKKYGNWNWTKGFDSELRLYSAIRRHLGAWHRGEDNDPESGLSHLAHASCGIMFLMLSRRYNLGVDDRWVRPEKFEVTLSQSTPELPSSKSCGQTCEESNSCQTEPQTSSLEPLTNTVCPLCMQAFPLFEGKTVKQCLLIHLVNDHEKPFEVANFVDGLIDAS